MQGLATSWQSAYQSQTPHQSPCYRRRGIDILATQNRLIVELTASRLAFKETEYHAISLGTLFISNADYSTLLCTWLAIAHIYDYIILAWVHATAILQFLDVELRPRSSPLSWHSHCASHVPLCLTVTTQPAWPPHSHSKHRNSLMLLLLPATTKHSSLNFATVILYFIISTPFNACLRIQLSRHCFRLRALRICALAWCPPLSRHGLLMLAELDDDIEMTRPVSGKYHGRNVTSRCWQTLPPISARLTFR